MNTGNRSCGTCTACCDGWVQMEIHGTAVIPGSPCPHSTGKGCAIYPDRPVEPCVNFNCGWINKNSPLPGWMHPPKGKCIVLFDKLRWNETPVDLAMPVGVKIPPRSLEWLKAFAEQHGRPLIYTEQIMQKGQFTNQQKVLGHGSAEFQQSLVQWLQKGRKLW